jgi:hypothetical protein
VVTTAPSLLMVPPLFWLDATWLNAPYEFTRILWGSCSRRRRGPVEGPGIGGSGAVANSPVVSWRSQNGIGKTEGQKLKSKAAGEGARPTLAVRVIDNLMV